MMFSSQACSLHSHSKLSPCRWSSLGPSLTGERGSTTLDPPSSSSPLQLLKYKKAHPKRHLACAFISSLLFVVTGIIAVYHAVKALHCQRNGYYEQALIHSRRSLSWSLATYVIALFIYLSMGLVIFIRSIDNH